MLAVSLNSLRQFSTCSFVYSKTLPIAHCFNANNDYQQLSKLGKKSKSAKERYAIEIAKKENMQNKIKSIYQSVETKLERVKQLESMVIKQERKIKQVLIEYYDES